MTVTKDWVISCSKKKKHCQQHHQLPKTMWWSKRKIISATKKAEVVVQLSFSFKMMSQSHETCHRPQLLMWSHRTFPLSRQGERPVDDDVDLGGAISHCHPHFLQARLQWCLTSWETSGHWERRGGHTVSQSQVPRFVHFLPGTQHTPCHSNSKELLY